jgi:flagellar motility protein MotE (MotC chaperone)
VPAQKRRPLSALTALPGRLVQHRWVRRILWIAGGLAAVAGIAVGSIAVYAWTKEVYAPPPTPSALLWESLKTQQQELERQLQTVMQEKAALGAEEAEYQRAMDELATLEKQMETALLARQSVDQAVAASTEAMAGLQQRLAATPRAETLDVRNIRKVTKILSAVKPAVLASIIKQLREDLALQVLLRMEERKVAKLLAVLEPAYAARLSTQLNALKAK